MCGQEPPKSAQERPKSGPIATIRVGKLIFVLALLLTTLSLDTLTLDTLSLTLITLTS